MNIHRKIQNDNIELLLAESQDEQLTNQYIDKAVNKMIALNNKYIGSLSHAIQIAAQQVKCREVNIGLTRSIEQLVPIQQFEDKQSFLFAAQSTIDQLETEYMLDNKKLHKTYLVYMINKMIIQHWFVTWGYLYAAKSQLPQKVNNYYYRLQTQGETNRLFSARKWCKRYQKFIKSMYKVNDELRTLGICKWMLDRYEISEKQHIKNVSNTCYIPPKIQCLIPNLDKQSIKIASWNVNVNVANNQNMEKRLAIAKAIGEIDPDIICFQEIKIDLKTTRRLCQYLMKYQDEQMKQEFQSINIDYELNRQDELSGGLATYIDVNIDHELFNHKLVPPPKFIQVIKLKLKENQFFFLINVYVFPDQRRVIIKKYITQTLYQLRQMYVNSMILVIGDFNEALSKYTDNTQIKQEKRLNKVEKYGLLPPKNLEYTHQGSCIDYFLQQNMNIKNHSVKWVQLCDHGLVYIDAVCAFDTFVRQQPINNNKRINNIFQPSWSNRIIDVNEVKQMQKYLIKRLTAKQKIERIIDPFQNFLQNVSGQLTDQYYQRFKQQINWLNQINDSAEFHKQAQRLFKLANNTPVVKQICDEDKNVLDEDQTDQKIFTKYKEQYSNNQQKQINPCNIPKLLVSPVDIWFTRKRIHPDKATADNLIPHTIAHNDFNLLWNAISLNNILTKRYPDQIYMQSRMLFFKKNKEDIFPMITNLRPITVTTIHLKMIEHILKSRINHIQWKMQSGQIGFIREQETSMHIMRMLRTLRRRKDNGFKTTILFFIDIAQAFDAVHHSRLLQKIKFYLQPSEYKYLDVIAWYLNQIGVNIGQYRIPVNRGAPQGGVLSPLLWLIYMNDLLLLLEKENLLEILSYADDMLIMADNLDQVERSSLILQKWADANQVTLNYKKDKTRLLIVQHTRIFHRYVYEFTLPLEAQDKYKYLGVVLDEKLTFPEERLKEAHFKAFTLKHQRLSVKKKMIIFQSYLLGKYRFLLLAIQFYPNKNLQNMVKKKTLQTIRQTLGLSKTCSEKKLLEQQLIKGTMEQILQCADNRVLQKLDLWDKSHNLPNQDWVKNFGSDSNSVNYDRSWESNNADDYCWLQLVVENEYWYIKRWCNVCNQRVLNRQHLITCKLFGDFIRIQFNLHLEECKDSSYTDRIDFSQNEIADLILHPYKINKSMDGTIFLKNDQRILFKEKLARSLDILRVSWRRCA